jgi:hypothetical protein
MSYDVLSFPDRLTDRRVSLVLVSDGKLLPPEELYAQIMRPLKVIKCHKWFFAHHRSEEAEEEEEEEESGGSVITTQVLPPLGCVVAECSPCGRVRLMLPCVAFLCQRLATAPAGMHRKKKCFKKTFMSWSWAEVVMERVTRHRAKKVQVRLQRRACCAVLCAALVVPVLACAVCLTRAAANACWF